MKYENTKSRLKYHQRAAELPHRPNLSDETVI